METTDIEPHPAQVAVPDFDSWACDTAECMELGIMTPTDTALFHPDFTYPLFGLHEKAFGYKDLSIKILFASGSLRAYADISYKAKYRPTATSSSSTDAPIEADDVGSILKKYMAQDTTTNIDEFMRNVQQDHTQYRPTGEKVHEYQIENEDGNEEYYEIYKCSFKDAQFREYHRRMQFFVLLFIEGSSYIEDDDQKWEIYTLFKKESTGDGTAYHFVGYSSAYPFYCWLEQTRMRISQFIILPPYQNMGHGAQLYQTIYEIFAQRKDVCEITVEDPNESFSDLRDRCDLRYLQDHGAFDGVTAPVPSDTIKELQKKFKLTSRQTQCCIELYLLSNLNKKDKHAYKTYRLQVKQRLYRFNYDALQEIELADRKEKLHQTYSSVESDYHRLLERV